MSILVSRNAVVAISYKLKEAKGKLAKTEKEKKRLSKALHEVADALDTTWEMAGDLHDKIAKILDDVGIRQKDESH